MATRSRIAIKTPEGILSIYCHWDGYPQGVGKTLKEHYTEETKILQLMELGNLSVLGPEIGQPQKFEDRSTHRDQWCLAYGRDRGEQRQEAKLFKDMRELQSYVAKSDQEYVYLFKDGSWKYWDVNYQEATSQWNKL